MPFLSALEVVYDDALLYKSTFTLLCFTLFYFTLLRWVIVFGYIVLVRN